MLHLQDLSDALDEIETRPRQSSTVLKIKKSLEDDYRKSLFEHVDKDDVNLLKTYFNKIINGTNLKLADMVTTLNNYIDDSDNEPYSEVVAQIRNELGSKEISIEDFLEFAEKFVVQNYPIDIFYKKYFKKSPLRPSLKPSLRPSLKPSLRPSLRYTDVFGDELEDLTSSSSEEEDEEDEENEEEKLKRVRSKIEEKTKILSPIPIIQPVEQKRRSALGRVAVIQEVPVPPPNIPQPKIVSDKIFFETMVDISIKDCEFLYRKIPWVKDVVNQIYIHPVEGNFKDILDFENFITYNDLKFYKPLEKYYRFLQCKTHKIQDGDMLTIVKEGNTFKLMVAIDTNSQGIKIQNEDMLKAEIDYIRVWNQNKSDHIKELKRSRPGEDMLFLAKFDLATALQDAIGGNVPISYRSNTSPFIKDVVEAIAKVADSGEVFVRLLADIVIFLKINLSFVTSSVFVKRLREQIYLPGTLPFLTDEDKLPEIFIGQNVPDETKQFVSKKLEEERARFTQGFFESVHAGASLTRKPTRPVLWNKPIQQIELPNLKSVCKNRSDVDVENDEDLVFYNDMDEVYCFNVYKLYNIFRDETPVNPYTKRPFSDKFIQTFLTRYASKPMVKKIDHTLSADLVTQLEQIIETEISLLENKLIENDNPQFIETFKSLTPIQPNTTVETPNICMQCKKTLDANFVKSVFRNKEVRFCDYECLEKNKAFK